MKTQYTKRIAKLSQIVQLLDEYQSVLAVVSHDGGRVAAFSAVVGELQSLESALLVPLQVIIQQRVALNGRMRAEIVPALSRAMSMAAALNDATMTNTFTYFYKDFRVKHSANGALQAAKVILEQVLLHPAEAAAAGFDAAAVSSLQLLVEQTTDMQSHTRQRGSLRRVDRNRMQQLLAEATAMLRQELDWMVEKHKLAEAGLYARYRALRQAKKGSKQTAESTDISGTVTDAHSGQAIAGALLQLVGHDGLTATSDADGYYLLDDPEPGVYQLRCTAQGYQMPADVAFSIARGESLQVNFSLSAQQAVA